MSELGVALGRLLDALTGQVVGQPAPATQPGSEGRLRLAVRYTYAVTTLTFALPDGAEVSVVVRSLLNAGYAGRDQAQVRAHIDELAELGVPAPATTPALYPVADYLAQQTDRVQVQHGRTSGEAEWAVVVGHLDRIELIGRVGAERAEIQRAPLAALLAPHYWLDRLAPAVGTGTVILSGTVAMADGVEPFADRWEVEQLLPAVG